VKKGKIIETNQTLTKREGSEGKKLGRNKAGMRIREQKDKKVEEG
jgi:hypothetical protein